MDLNVKAKTSERKHIWKIFASMVFTDMTSNVLSMEKKHRKFWYSKLKAFSLKDC